MFAIPIAPTSSATAPRPSSSVVNWPFAAARASSTSDGRLTLTPLGSCGLAVAAQQVRDRGHVVLAAANVDLGRLRQLPEQPLGDRQRDEHDRVQRRVEHDGVEDPDDDEPGVAEVDHHVAADVVDLQRRRGLGAEHDLREALG